MTDALFSNSDEYPRARFLLASWLLVVLLAPGFGNVLSLLPDTWPAYWEDVTHGLYVNLLTVLLLVLMYRIPNQVPFWRVLGRPPTRKEIGVGIATSVYMLLVAWAAIYLLFFPLTYVIPDFVDFWLLDSPSLIISDGGVVPLIPNALQLVSLCIAVPVLEEIIFRGLVLHRLTQKRSLGYAVFWSSLIFGLLHPDVLGAFLFGVGMCALYVQTRSLLVPIVCHSVYNFAVWLIAYGYFLKGGPDSAYGIQEFQQELIYGLLAGAALLCWSLVLYRKGILTAFWRTPRERAG